LHQAEAGEGPNTHSLPVHYKRAHKMLLRAMA